MNPEPIRSISSNEYHSLMKKPAKHLDIGNKKLGQLVKTIPDIEGSKINVFVLILSGPSGSGKSTLLDNLVSGNNDLVNLFGYDRATKEIFHMNRIVVPIAYARQQTEIPNYTFGICIAYCFPILMGEHIIAACVWSSILTMLLAKGGNNMIINKYQLSGGEMQRIVIFFTICGILSGVSVVILDEPFNHLNSFLRFAIANFLLLLFAKNVQIMLVLYYEVSGITITKSELLIIYTYMFIVHFVIIIDHSGTFLSVSTVFEKQYDAVSTVTANFNKTEENKLGKAKVKEAGKKLRDIIEKSEVQSNVKEEDDSDDYMSTDGAAAA